MTKKELINAINASEANTAWDKGVKEYALNLVEEIYENDTDIVKADLFVCLRGAEILGLDLQSIKKRVLKEAMENDKGCWIL